MMRDFGKLDRLLKGFVDNGLPGCGCAVGLKGETVYENYFGYSDLAEHKPLTMGTLFRQASTTKVITVTAAMMLYEEGRFLLNDPLYEYFPEYRNTEIVKYAGDGSWYTEKAKNPILVKDAFRMTCGLPYENNSVSSQAMQKVREELVKKYGKYDILQEVKAMGSVPVAFEPGTRWLYGYGHDILSGLITLLSGKPTRQFVQENIFEPLGMTSSGYRFLNGNEKNMTKMYCMNTEDRTCTEVKTDRDILFQEDQIYDGGGAGIYSTVADYLKFAKMLANGGEYNGSKILGSRTIALIAENQLNEQQLNDYHDFYLDGYGYGLGVRTLMNRGQANSNFCPGEFGWTGAFGSYTAIDPSIGLSVVYMHQLFPNLQNYYHLRVRNTVNGCI